MARRKRETGHSYNLQGWVDVRKIVRIIQGIEGASGVSVSSMSELARILVDIVDNIYEKRGIQKPETIPEAFEWLKRNRYTTLQYSAEDSRMRLIKGALELEDIQLEQATPGIVQQTTTDDINEKLRFEMEVGLTMTAENLSREEAEDSVDPNHERHQHEL